MAELMEEQWQSNVEMAEHSDVEPFTGFYTHLMWNMDRAVMSQTKYEDPERHRVIYSQRLVRVIVQTSRKR